MLEVSSGIIEEMIQMLDSISGAFKAELEIRSKYGHGHKERLITHKVKVSNAIDEAKL